MDEVTLYKLKLKMLRIRMIEESIAREYPKLEMRCPVHLSIGQEAIAVGVCSILTIYDMVFSGHRAHAHYLAKGGDLKAFIAELHGKESGCCKGIGGSMHLQDENAGFVGSTAIVGGTVPLAVGAAWANRIKNNPDIVVVFFGDGCFEEGIVSESLNFAALHGLRILFVCENNNLAVTTTSSDRKSNQFNMEDIVNGYGVKYYGGDGQNLENILSIMEDVETTILMSDTPCFIELTTERERVHCGIEYEHKLTNDPLRGFHADKYDIEQIESEIKEAFDFARRTQHSELDRAIYA